MSSRRTIATHDEHSLTRRLLDVLSVSSRARSTRKRPFDDTYQLVESMLLTIETSFSGATDNNSHGSAVINLFQTMLDIHQLDRSLVQIGEKLTMEQARQLREAVSDAGHRTLAEWYVARVLSGPAAATLTTHHASLSLKSRCATRPFWNDTWTLHDSFYQGALRDMSNKPSLKLTRDEDADGKPLLVTVDLWHSRLGMTAPDELFRDFEPGIPTWFFGSRGEVVGNIEQLREFFEGGDEEEEDTSVWTKRGRFQFNPLLWFDDVSVTRLLNDPAKRKATAIALNSHASIESTQEGVSEKGFDPDVDTDDKKAVKRWRKALHQRRVPVVINEDDVRTRLLELRMDNNCFNKETLVAVEKQFGYNGSLCVDVSGFEALQPPDLVGPNAVETESIVVWNVPGCLVEEWEWERVSG